VSRELHIDILFCLIVQNFTFFHVLFEVLFVLLHSAFAAFLLVPFCYKLVFHAMIRC
jgi:hypothetical protein